MPFIPRTFIQALERDTLDFVEMSRQLYWGARQHEENPDIPFVVDTDTQGSIWAKLSSLLPGFLSDSEKPENWAQAVTQQSLEHWVIALSRFEATDIRAQLLENTATIIEKVEPCLDGQTISTTLYHLSGYEQQNEQEPALQILSATQRHLEELSGTGKYLNKDQIAFAISGLQHFSFCSETVLFFQTIRPHLVKLREQSTWFDPEHINLIFKGIGYRKIHAVMAPIWEQLHLHLSHLPTEKANEIDLQNVEQICLLFDTIKDKQADISAEQLSIINAVRKELYRLFPSLKPQYELRVTRRPDSYFPQIIEPPLPRIVEDDPAPKLRILEKTTSQEDIPTPAGSGNGKVTTVSSKKAGHFRFYTDIPMSPAPK